jgi:hypothetical protein
MRGTSAPPSASGMRLPIDVEGLQGSDLPQGHIEIACLVAGAMGCSRQESPVSILQCDSH